MTILYFDCFAGASGDMILGALVALGVDEKELLTQIQSLKLDDCSVDFAVVDRAGISAVKANVRIPRDNRHRNLHDIIEIIERSALKDSIKKRAIAIFTNLGSAEAKVHGVALDKIHFHEVGALDAIIDVVGACVGFDMLGIESFACSKVHVGSGFVKMAHGNYPVPPPAVAELLTGVPAYSTEITGELVTPTGAAIIAAVCESYGALPEMTIQKIGYGAGTREYPHFPNVLRLITGIQNPKSKIQNQTDYLILLETNLDDTDGQTIGFVMERAFKLGALDCWTMAINMKKSRPAVQLSILCEKNRQAELEKLLFVETTTLGVRVREVERHSLPREFVTVSTIYGEISMKIARIGSEIKAAPEFEDLRRAAIEHKVTLREVEAAARTAFAALPANKRGV